MVALISYSVAESVGSPMFICLGINFWDHLDQRNTDPSFFFYTLIYKDSQFNNTKMKNSKISVQNKGSVLEEILYVSQQGLYT